MYVCMYVCMFIKICLLYIYIRVCVLVYLCMYTSTCLTLCYIINKPFYCYIVFYSSPDMSLSFLSLDICLPATVLQIKFSLSFCKMFAFPYIFTVVIVFFYNFNFHQPFFSCTLWFFFFFISTVVFISVISLSTLRGLPALYLSPVKLLINQCRPASSRSRLV